MYGAHLWAESHTQQSELTAYQGIHIKLPFIVGVDIPVYIPVNVLTYSARLSGCRSVVKDYTQVLLVR